MSKRDIKKVKAQAALEFLATYGWAFMVILIMIAALAYFGIFNPSGILPNRCTFGTEFQCMDYSISGSADTFKLKLKSEVSEAIDVQSITLASETSTQYACTTIIPAMPYTGWKSGVITDFSWSSCNSALAGFSVGEKGKILLTIRYNSAASGSTYVREVKGEVYSSVT